MEETMKITTKQAAFLRQQLAAEMQGEDALLRKVLAACPDKKLGWKPTAKKSKPFAELAWHAGDAGHFFCDVIEGKEPKDSRPSAKSKKALTAALTKSGAKFQKRLASYTPAQLAKSYDFFGTKYSGITLLSWHKVHLVHHRGQLTTYLRVMGAKVPSIYGGSADEPMGGG
jgi:uncharacterized damage-inducible protein DinB